MRNWKPAAVDNRAQKFSLTRLFLVAFVGFLVGGGALAVSPFASPPEASAVPATKSIERSATLSTTDQNMWGSGASSATDVELVLFNETWNESGGFGGVESVCIDTLCAYFGASINASVSGEIGMSIVIDGLEGGTLSVTYPVTVTFTAPADNSFDPGAAVDIKTSMVVDSTKAKIVSSFPALDHVGLNGILDFKAAASGSGCVIGCIEGEIFNIDEGWDGEIFGLDPTDINTCFEALPLGFPWLLSTYTNDRCADKGYFFDPDVEVVSTFNADGTISATGQDQYAVIPVNAYPWGGQNFDLGLTTIGYSLFNAIITAIETMKQDLLFTPRVDVTLNWAKDLGYEVLDGSNDGELSSGSGTSATFKVGDTLRLTTNSLNSKVIPITPTLSMGSATMANNTRNANTTDARLVALSFTIGTPASGTRDATSDSAGPVYEESFPLGTTEASIFNATFNIGGFNSSVLEGFEIVPRPIVEVRKSVVPFNSPGRFNLKIDNAILAANVSDGDSTGRIVVEPGTRVISETAATGSDLNFFDISITCVESDGGAVHTQSAGASPGLGSSMDLVLTGGEDLICTIKNRLPAPSECDTMVFDNVILGTPGSNAADTLKGTNQRDIIIGYGGNDIIDSGSGDDCVSGIGGNDRIELGAGNDVGDGGDGNDNFGAGPGDDIIHAGAGNDEVGAGAGNDLVYGDAGDDVVSGGAGIDTIEGGDGKDTLTGGSEKDALDGGPGIDAAHGSSGVDSCVAETKTNCEN